MLEIQELDIELKILNKRKYKKSQIILFDTFRNVENYLNKLKHRIDGEYEDIPHFIVTKNGIIIKLLDENFYSKTFNNPIIDKKFIKIAIENNGWLEKNNLNNTYHNWIDDVYRGVPHQELWRNKLYWDKYTDIQIIKVEELCDYLCEKFNISNHIVPDNSVIENINKFKGIVYKSNYSNIYKDINPSFKIKKNE